MTQTYAYITSTTPQWIPRSNLPLEQNIYVWVLPCMTGCLPSLSLLITCCDCVWVHTYWLPGVSTMSCSLLCCQNCLSGMRWTSAYMTANDSTVMPIDIPSSSCYHWVNLLKWSVREGESDGEGSERPKYGELKIARVRNSHVSQYSFKCCFTPKHTV